MTSNQFLRALQGEGTAESPLELGTRMLCIIHHSLMLSNTLRAERHSLHINGTSVTLSELHSNPERWAVNTSTLQVVSEKQNSGPLVREDQDSSLGLVTPCPVAFVGSDLHTGEKDIAMMKCCTVG